MKQVLVHRDNYKTRIYDYSTREQQIKSIKRMFKNNKESKHYFDISNGATVKETEKELSDIEKDLYNITLTTWQSEKMLTAISELKEEKAKLEKYLKEIKEARDLYRSAIKGDVKAIYKLINIRKDYEYERLHFWISGTRKMEKREI